MKIEETFHLLVVKLFGWARELILMLPNLLVAVVVLVAAWAIARLARELALRLLGRFSHSRQINRLLAQLLFLSVLAGGLFVGLGVLGLDRALTSLLAGAGLIGLALSLAFQGIAANFMSGIYLSIRRPFRTGNLIESNKVLGTVEQVHLLWTEVRTPQGQLVLLPNKKIFDEPIINYTRLGRRRIDLKAGIGYGEDLARVGALGTRAIEALPGRTPGRPVELFYTRFGASAIEMVVRVWIDATDQTAYLAAQSDAITRLKRAFDAEGISLPFPTYTVDLAGASGEAAPALLTRSAAAGPSGLTRAGRAHQR